MAIEYDTPDTRHTSIYNKEISV